jgi:hypothetical protein
MSFILGGGNVTAEDKARIAQREERIRKDADPLIMRRIDRWINHGMLPGRRTTAPMPPLPQAMRPQPTHFDKLSDWYCGYLGVRDDYERPVELQQDLKQGVPQAILRDIYRPVKNFIVEWEYPGADLDPAGQRSMAEAKAAQRREPVAMTVSSLAIFRAEQRRQKSLRQTPWQSWRPDSAPRRHSEQDPILINEQAE